MKRAILAAVAGIAIWFLLLTLTGVVMSVLWPDYAAVREAMTFTLPMMIARLALGAVTLPLAAYIAGKIARDLASRAALIMGIVLTVIFIPVHVNLWDKFPVWYHLAFLLTIVPLCLMGGRIAHPATAPTASAQRA